MSDIAPPAPVCLMLGKYDRPREYSERFFGDIELDSFIKIDLPSSLHGASLTVDHCRALVRQYPRVDQLVVSPGLDWKSADNLNKILLVAWRDTITTCSFSLRVRENWSLNERCMEKIAGLTALKRLDLQHFFVGDLSPLAIEMFAHRLEHFSIKCSGEEIGDVVPYPIPLLGPQCTSLYCHVGDIMSRHSHSPKWMDKQTDQWMANVVKLHTVIVVRNGGEKKAVESIERLCRLGSSLRLLQIGVDPFTRYTGLKPSFFEQLAKLPSLIILELKNVTIDHSQPKQWTNSPPLATVKALDLNGISMGHLDPGDTDFDGFTQFFDQLKLNNDVSSTHWNEFYAGLHSVVNLFPNLRILQYRTDEGANEKNHQQLLARFPNIDKVVKYTSPF